MTAYFDSSALVAVYVTELHSEAARIEIRRHASVPWTQLHDLEVRHALRLLHGREQIDQGELAALLLHIDEDLREGRLARPAIVRNATRDDVARSSRSWIAAGGSWSTGVSGGTCVAPAHEGAIDRTKALKSRGLQPGPSEAAWRGCRRPSRAER